MVDPSSFGVQRQAEQSPLENERALVRAQQVANIGSWELDLREPLDLRQGTLRWSDQCYRIFGFEPRSVEVNRELFFQSVHPEDRDKVVETFAEALRTGADYELLHRIVRRDGTERTIHEIGVIEYDAQRRPRRLLGTAQDVTERSRAEALLKESEGRFRTMVDSTPLMMWITDEEGRIQFANRAYLEFFNVAQEHVDDFHWRSMLHPEDADQYIATFADAVRNLRPFQARARVRRADGKWRWIESRGNPRFDASGTLIGYAGSSQDITEIVETQEASREADRRKDEFLATLAHELRNPLAPLCNGLHVLQMSRVVEPDTKRVQDMMERQVNQMVRLVDDLLEMSRITRGKIELRRENVSLASVVRSAVEASRPLMQAAGHELVISMPSDPICLDADPVRLAQVLANLLNNAAKFTDKPGEIRLAVRLEKDKVLITVRDTGSGIRRDMLPRIFDMFTQGEPSGVHRGGLGIGLTLVRSLVEMHGGSVEAQSEGPGRGSEFTVRLPLAEQAMETPVPVPPAVETSIHSRILVVDDNEDAADSLATLLKCVGAVADVAYDGPTALRTIAEHKPNVVLLDLGMPGMDGYEVARRIRSDPQLSSLTLIALSGWGQEADRRRSRNAGFDHHLLKPADLATLRTLLLLGERAAGRPRSH
jgi:PAS domain S-box-containing protein